jgi:hypothetical protein
VLDVSNAFMVVLFMQELREEEMNLRSENIRLHRRIWQHRPGRALASGEQRRG